MQLSLLQENINTALTVVSRFVSSKTQLPILSNILFTTDNGRLKLSATNLELGINYWLGAKIESEGSFTLPAKEIVEFVSYLPSGKVDLNLTPQNLLEVASIKAQSVFSTVPAADFPSLPSLDPQSAISLDSKVFADTISQVAFAAATDDTRPILTAVLCLFTPEIVTLVATDGFRLSLKKIKLAEPITLPNGAESLTLLIPARSLTEITKLSKTGAKLSFGVSSDTHQLVFVLDDVEVVSRLVEGEFPPYSRIIPESFVTKIFVNKTELAQAVKIASVFARESANVIRFNIKSTGIDITANAPQVGQNKVTLDARLEGEPLDVAFNFKFISDFISVCKGEEIVIELNDALAATFFHDLSNPDFTHIIMPVRIQD